MTNDMIVCRCEGVYLSDIERAIEEGATSIPGLKIRTRSGMGMCQGRVCQSSLRNIVLSHKQGNDQPIVLQKAKFPIRPTTLGDMTK
ncbi:(2Fe-2S)-binding protein [Psychrobacillus sp. NPDC093180]|uniref:(2Fe-2S)-binding protein n=1 Tax=Psychrobacillus sp. NPDC093180 TaxID=3364489 RepID=UPI00380FBF32